MRSSTRIGANVAEVVEAQSKKDFISKMSIVKEANETKYWLRLLITSEYVDIVAGESLEKELVEIIKILTAIISH